MRKPCIAPRLENPSRNPKKQALGRSLEKGKATHSSVLAWRIPWTVQSMGSQRVGQDCVTFTFTFHFRHTLPGLTGLWPLQ